MDDQGPASAAPGAFRPHAMFPREDGGPETRDISFIRLTRVGEDGSEKRHPRDYPAADLPSWEKCHELWGGGTYKARGLDGNHSFSTGDTEWVAFEGASKPFGAAPGKVKGAAPAAPFPPASAPASAAPAGPAEPSGVAAAITGLATVLGALATAWANRPLPPPPPPPPPPDTSLQVAMLNSQTQMVTALLSRPTPVPDNSLAIALLNSQKPPADALALAETIAKISRQGAGAGAANGVRETVETFRALKDVMGPGGEGGKSEIADLVGGVTALAQLGGGKSEPREEGPPPRREPEARRSVKLRHPVYGLIELHDPTPEMLAQLAAPPRPALPSPPTITPPAPPAAQPQVVTPPAPPAAQPQVVVPAMNERDEIAALADRLRRLDTAESERLTALLRAAHAAEPSPVEAGPAPSPPAIVAPAPSAALPSAEPVHLAPAASAPPAATAPAPPPLAPAAQAPSPPATLAASGLALPDQSAPAGGRLVNLGGTMVEVVEERAAEERPPIQLGAGLTDAEVEKVIGMDPDVIEAQVVKRFGPKSAGIGDAMRAMIRDAPLQAGTLLRSVLPPDAVRALANGTL